jgi:hypothetical protein
LLRTSSKQKIASTLSHLLDTKRALATWWQSLPKVIIHPDISHGFSSWRAAMHVRLEYCLVRLFVGRPVLLNRSCSQPHSEASPESEEMNCTNGPLEFGKKPASRRLELVNDCVSAAQEALDICRSLRDYTPGLARASYIEYSSCRASLLVLIACSVQDETCQFYDLLQHGLDMICEMSAAGDSARSEVSLIESLERALSHLQPVDLQTSNHNSTAASHRRYDSFKSWESTLQMKNSNHNTTTSCESHYNVVDSGPTAFRLPGQSLTPAYFPSHFDQSLPRSSIYTANENNFPNTQASVPNNSEIETVDPFSSVYSSIDLDLFSERHINLATSGSLHPESQLLDGLLRTRGFDFNSSL